MARRKARRLLVTGALRPEDIASGVISAYTSTAQKKIANWMDDYRKRVLDYTRDKNKQDVAKAKLINWYNVFLSLVYPRLSGVYSEAKAEYARAKATMVAPPPTPPTPPA
jgi:hypothetical protein